MSLEVTLESAVVLPLLDGLAGLVPIGFSRAELCFVPSGGEHPWEFDRVSVEALPDAPRLDEVVDGRASTRLLTHLAADIGAYLGAPWDGQLTLVRESADWRLGCNAAAELRVSHEYANGRTFDDGVLFELARIRTTIVERQRAFVDTYGLPDESWQLDPLTATLSTPHGELVCALIAVHEGRLLHWSPMVDGPPPALIEPLKALLASGKAPRAMARGRVVIEAAELGHPLAWLAAEPMGALAVLLWPAEGNVTLLLALLEP